MLPALDDTLVRHYEGPTLTGGAFSFLYFCYYCEYCEFHVKRLTRNIYDDIIVSDNVPYR